MLSRTCETTLNYTAAANIDVRVREPLGHTLDPLQIAERVARTAKENAARVISRAVDFSHLAALFVASPSEGFHNRELLRLCRRAREQSVQE